MDMFYMPYQPPKKHVPTEQNHDSRIMFTHTRKENGSMRTFSRANETTGLKPNVENKQHETKALKPYLKQERHDTKAVPPPCKTQVQRDQFLETACKTRATCTSGLWGSQSIRVCYIQSGCSTWTYLYMWTHSPEKYVPTKRNCHCRVMCVQTERKCMHTNIFHCQQD